ncbi:MAG: SRPBCC family protein [Cyanobacteria bacterium]|nr:SRPBCC family protein [Cyanobacteriota bacterium]
MLLAKNTVNPMVCMALLLLALLNGQPALARTNSFSGNAFSGLQQPSRPEAASVLQAESKITVDAPIHLVWETLTTPTELKEFLPGYKKSTLLQVRGNQKWFQISQSVIRFFPAVQYQLQVQENPKTYQVQLNRVSGDFKALQGFYALSSDGQQRTVLTYRLGIDPGGLRLPGSQRLVFNQVQETLQALKERSEWRFQKSMIGQR